MFSLWFFTRPIDLLRPNLLQMNARVEVRSPAPPSTPQSLAAATAVATESPPPARAAPMPFTVKSRPPASAAYDVEPAQPIPSADANTPGRDNWLTPIWVKGGGAAADGPWPVEVVAAWPHPLDELSPAMITLKSRVNLQVRNEPPIFRTHPDLRRASLQRKEAFTTEHFLDICFDDLAPPLWC